MMEASVHASKERKGSSGRSSSGGYYKFTYYDDASSSDDDLPRQLSPKELVDKILRETEFDNRPISGTDSGIPELDFTVDFPEVDSDECTSALDIDAKYGIYDPGYRDSPDRSSPDSTQQPVEPLDSPLNHPDSGYIEFLSESDPCSPRISNPSFHSEGFSDNDPHVDNESLHSLDIAESNPNFLSDTSSKTKTKSNSFPSIIRFRKFKSDFERLEEDSYIDDDINSSELQQESYKDLDESLAEYMDNQRGKGSRKSAKRTESATDSVFLPMQPVETALGFEDESMLESERHETDDTNPIIVEEGSLVIKTQNRLRKVRIIIGIVAGIAGLAAIGAIVYLLVRFL